MPTTHDTHSHAFEVALGHAISQAVKKYPDEKKRILRAAELAKNGHVAITTDHEALVRSASNPETVYHVNGTCQCVGYQFGQRRCAHRWAKSLYRKALTVLESLWYAQYNHEAGVALALGDALCFTAEATGDRAMLSPTNPHLILLGRCAVAGTAFAVHPDAFSTGYGR